MKWTPISKTLALVAILTLDRLVVSSLFGPGDAEALYWTYGRHLQAAYLDHPPLTGWLLALSNAVLGPTPLGIRIVPILLFDVTVIAAHLLGSAMWKDPEAGWWSALAVSLSPASLIGGVAAAPDAPLAAFWLLSALFLWKSIERPDSGLLYPALTGISIGLAILSKHTGACLALGALVLAVRVGYHRRPGFHVALVLALLTAAPVVLWNMDHDWIQLRHRLFWTQGGAGFSMRNLGALVGGQALYMGPALILYFGVLAKVARPPTIDYSFIFWLSVPTLGITYLLCLWSRVAEPHWPFAGYLVLAIGAGGLLKPLTAGMRRIWRVSMGYAFGAYLLAHIFILFPVLPCLLPANRYEPRYDLTNELYGWPEAAEQIRRMAKPGEKVAAAHYTLCSQLTFALSRKNDPQVVCASPEIDDFDLWGLAPRKGDPLIFVTDNRFPDLPQVLRTNRAEKVSSLEITRGGRWVRRFDFYRLMMH